MGKGNRFRRGGKQPLGDWLRLKVRLTLLLGWRLQLNKTWLLVKGKALLALLFSSSSQESLSLSPACCPPHFRPPLSKYWFQANSTPLNYWLPKTHTHDCTCHHFRNKTLQVLLGCWLTIYNETPSHLASKTLFHLMSTEWCMMQLFMGQLTGLKCVRL